MADGEAANLAAAKAALTGMTMGGRVSKNHHLMN
jgi:hypothetical protein